MNDSRRQQSHLATFVTGGLHVLAIMILAVATAGVFASEASWQIIGWAWSEGALADTVLVELCLHVGLCALTWATLVFVVGRARRLAARLREDEPRDDQLRDDRRTTVKLTSTRGTVLTETLIVLPIALLLIMGIAQMALVNIASTLSDLAVMQAARSVWVWAPEAQEGRFNVDRTLVTEKARVQAAAIMAPTASANFGDFKEGNQLNYSGTFRKTMGAIYGAQLDANNSDVGSYSTTEAELELSGGSEAIGRNMAFNLAFDSTDFQTRVARKFFNAWVGTEIELLESRDTTGAKMTYHHLCLMPLVAGMFGEHKQVNGQEGYFLTFERSYSLPKQVKPNAHLPRF